MSAQMRGEEVCLEAYLDAKEEEIEIVVSPFGIFVSSAALASPSGSRTRKDVFCSWLAGEL